MMHFPAKRWAILALMQFLLFSVLACNEALTAQPQPGTVPPTSSPLSATLTFATPATAATPAATRVTPAAAIATPPRFKSPTPPPNPGTTISAAGQYRIVANPVFYWTLRLPQDWVITYDRGFEILANNPGQTAFLHLVSQVWRSAKERLPTARDYVTYWKHYIYGDVFPVYAKGTQVSETEISRDKFGGPYLRYEFDDSRNAMLYVQVYASGGGPNSVVLTGLAKKESFDAVKTTLEDILQSLALLQKP